MSDCLSTENREILEIQLHGCTPAEIAAFAVKYAESGNWIQHFFKPGMKPQKTRFIPGEIVYEAMTSRTERAFIDYFYSTIRVRTIRVRPKVPYFFVGSVRAQSTNSIRLVISLEGKFRKIVNIRSLAEVLSGRE